MARVGSRYYDFPAEGVDAADNWISDAAGSWWFTTHTGHEWE